MSEEAEMSDDDKEEELYSPSAEVSDESGNGDATEQNQKFVSIFVGNLGETTGPPDIKELFESYGITVDHVDMKICFAFVHCLWVTNLQEIVTRMQGSLFRNRCLHVIYALDLATWFFSSLQFGTPTHQLSRHLGRTLASSRNRVVEYSSVFLQPTYLQPKSAQD